MSESTVVLTPDTFLNILELPEIEHKIKGAEQKQALFRLAIEFLGDEAVASGSSEDASTLGELPLRIPNTPYVVRLSQLTSDELKAILAVAVSHFFVSGKLDWETLTVAAVVAVQNRLKKLNADYGERSVADALSEVSRKSARDITLRLNGHLCRYPESGCRYRVNGDNCGIKLDQVETILGDLVESNVLRKETSVAPIEYALIL